VAKQCYLCGDPATSVEHVPEKCFFPDYHAKTQLITVTACAPHNELTSADDEYVRNVIAMALGNNRVGSDHALTKVLRSLQRSVPLQKTTFKDVERVQTVHGETYRFRIDRDRIERVMKKVGYGLYFHATKQPWARELIVSMPALQEESGGVGLQDAVAQLAEFARAAERHDGANPDVFRYFLRWGSQDKTIIVAEFYENFPVWIMPVLGSTSSAL
jgi:hypothetical protein